MSLNIVVTPGYTFPPAVPITLAGLRRGALPTVSISGSVATSDLVDGAVTAAKVSPDAYFYGLDTGVVNAAVVNFSPAIAAYADGLVVAFKVKFPNTGAVTLAGNGLPAAPMKKNGNLDLDPGDWKAGQIVVARYQLDANVLAPGVSYDGTGANVLAVTPGRTYTWTKGANDTNLVSGATTLTATGTFVPQTSTVTLNGTLSTLITATVIPVSNVWQMLSQLGNSNRVFPFKGATALRRGEAGLIPAPKAGDQNKFLRMDGTLQDVVALAVAAASAANSAGINVFNQQNLN